MQNLSDSQISSLVDRVIADSIHSSAIQEHISLAPFTTLRIGGPARYFCRVTSEPELLDAVRFARARSLPIFVLGGGSNLLVADTGFPGLVLHIAFGDNIASTADRTHMKVSAGHDWDAFVRIVCEQGLSGIECLAGIPGLVGGSPIQNIGAYGQEVATTVTSLRALDLQSPRLDNSAFVEMAAAHCRFAYRFSIFNSTEPNRYIITRVDFTFDPSAKPNLAYAELAPLSGTNPTPLDVYHAVRAIRDRKGMVIDPAHPHLDTRSAGSFFKNPVVPAPLFAAIAAASPTPLPHWPTPIGEVKLAAAWLIEQSGFPKGFTLGPVGISSRHTLALVNRTGIATCADLLHLRDTIVTAVTVRFGVTLEQEPVYIS